MLYNAPTGAQSGNEGYAGKNVGAGQQGSRVPPMAIEGPQRELVAVIAEAGAAPTNIDLKQVLKAIRSGLLSTYADVSPTANALVIEPLTVHTVLNKGLPFRVWPAHDNTGPCTLSVSGITRTLSRRTGTALLPKDIQANVPFDCVFDGSGFVLVGLAPSEVPRVVSNPVLWVRTDGSDLNDGSENFAGKAFATIEAALAYGQTYFATAGSRLTIRLGVAGTYAAPTQRIQNFSNLLILGDAAAQASYVISGSGAAGNTGVLHCDFGALVLLRGLTLYNAGTTHNWVTSGSGAVVLTENVTFAGINNPVGWVAYASNNGFFGLLAGCRVQSSAYAMFYTTGGGSITQFATLTIVGALTFTYFAFMDGGRYQISPGVTFTFAAGASVTGIRYGVTVNGSMNTLGGGANFLPGSVAGSVSTGGVYV